MVVRKIVCVRESYTHNESILILQRYSGSISSDYRFYTSKDKPQIIDSIQFPHISSTKQCSPEKQRFIKRLMLFLMLFFYSKKKKSFFI